MTRMEKLRHHTALLDDTATRLGLDLQEAAIRGSLAFHEISDAVMRCADCADPETCSEWLAGRAEAGAKPLPAYCRNAALMARLQKAH